jgi:hypothetical protein
MNTRHRFACRFALLYLAGLLTAGNAHATITVLNYWRMGESDPGAVSGGTVTTTRDSVVSSNLTFVGSPTYTNDVSRSAAAHSGSALSISIPAGAFATNAAIPGLVDNFGIEAWVKPTEVTNGQTIAYNGSTSTSGWGLILGPNDFYGLYGGRVVIDAGPASNNVWTHLALVRASGVTVMYVNGVPTATNNTAPAVPSGRFGVGAPPQIPTSQFYAGNIDELRVFTFAPNQFSVNDLLFFQPEVVTSLADGGGGSLRTVLAGADPGSTIVFATNGVITLTNGPITLASSVNLIGPGPTNLVLSGGHSSRVLIIDPGATNFLSGLAIRNGLAGGDLNGGGGGIYNAGDLTLSNCEIAFNTAATGAGGSPMGLGNPGSPGGPGGPGGGVFNLGYLGMIACLVHDNQGGPGGIGGAAVSFTSYATAGGPGGGAGGLYNSGTAELLACTFSSNSAGIGGGGGNGYLSVPAQTSGGPGAPGGAIYNEANAEITIINSTLDGNAAGAGGPGSPGIVIPGLPPQEAGPPGPPGRGGGIFNLGVLEMFSDTITRNNGLASGGGVFCNGEASGQNTLIALNTASEASDYSGSFSTQGHNLIGNNEGSFGFFVGNDNDLVGVSNAPVNPVVGPLSYNGGLTPTVALLAGSPAINAGDDAVLGAPNFILTDQRGEARKTGAHVDVGAYEVMIGYPPWLVPVKVGANAVFSFTFTNTPHAVFSVLASSNIEAGVMDWTLVGPPVETAPGLFQFSDSVSNAVRRFYRVSSP